MAIWEIAFAKSPIILQGGIAGTLFGGYLPIIALTAVPFVGGIPIPLGVLQAGLTNFDPDRFFATFQPMPGTTLIENAVGEYPFANQTVAANAIIQQPLNISMMMYVPVQPPNTYTQKFLIMQSLQASLQQHNISGGMYTILTPSAMYQSCIMTRMVDISRGEGSQPQIQWQIDFRQPLVTQAAAATAQNTLISKLTNGTQVTPDATGAVGWTNTQPSAAPSPAGDFPLLPVQF